MKKVLLFITMACTLLFAQCKKDDSASSAGKPVKMTITVGPGSKTDITDDGAITWSAGDRLYVGDGEKYIGCLTLKSGEDTPTGTFSGDVDLTGITKGTEHTFHFFYLGSTDYTSSLTSGKSTTVDVDFSKQDIKVNNGKLVNASKYHVGYGKANGTVIDDVVTEINVMLVSKVALAHFSFKKGTDAYTGALTLKGDNICNKMTVNFAGTFEGTSGSTTDGITLAGGHGERYVMLVPTAETTDSQALTFAGDGVSGKTTLANGIKPNQFYGLNGALEVSLKGPFSTSATTGVEFAPGNLYYNGASDASKMNKELPSGWNFYDNQWDCYASGTSSATTSMEISLFTWGYGNWSTVYNTDTHETANTMTDWGSVAIGGDAANTWRTLTNDEWMYLMDTRTSSTIGSTCNARYAEVKVNGVCGMMLFPDEFTWPVDVTSQPTTFNTYSSTWNGVDYTTADFGKLESAGVVFLPAAGNRYQANLYNVGSFGHYWSSTYNDSDKVYLTYFARDSVNPQYTSVSGRSDGFSVRLVR